MKLSTKQQEFSLAIADLIESAYLEGYGLTFGNAYMKPGSNDGRKKTSTHRNRLAVDFNIFKNGKYLTGSAATKGHNLLHNHWDKIGGAKRIAKDLNHYSFKHNGVI